MNLKTLKRSLYLLIALSLVACTTVTLQPAPTAILLPSPIPNLVERAGWNLVWQDEFEGTELDQTNWTFDLGGNG
jgi:hypothetical protein